MIIEKKLNIIINWNELKFRIFYYILTFFTTFFICFYYRVELFFIISNIFLKYEYGFIYTNLLEPFIIYLKISLFFSIIITLPFFLYNFGYFFLKSSYDFNTKYFIIYLLYIYISSLFIYIFFFNFAFPFFLEFLFSFQRTNSFEILKLVLQATMVQYYHFFFNYILYFFLIILIPNLFLIGIFINLFNKKHFYNFRFRKYLYFIIIINYIIIAPPDIYIQLLFMPFIILFFEFLLYFISFFFSLYYWFN